MKRRVCTLVLLLAAVVCAGKTAEAPATVTLENAFVRLVVNNSADGQGRFAVDVTGGDRARATDDGQPLIYGRPVPWTSYTTVRLDGRVHAYGGPTSRRAGKDLPPGVMVSPPRVHEGAILSTWRYGDLEVTQSLSIVEGPTTGLPDTARIAYILANQGETRHRVGLRVVLDTMLGSNDGAPFRLGEKQILTDEWVQGKTATPYWQAFDSLGDPSVVAQGTLAGGELTPPDRLFFTNWGTLADAPWEPPLVAGRDFTRLGEFEPDSAVALIWDDVELAPGGVLTRTTYYGLGGLTIAKGELTLGVTAPASAASGDGGTFTILGYLENRGKGVAQDVVMTLDLSETVRPVSPRRVPIGRLKPGESRQVAWLVEGIGAGTARIRITAEAFQLAPTVVEREIRLLAPARLGLKALDPPVVRVVAGRYEPYPVEVGALVANTGGNTAPAAWAQIVPGPGLRLAPGEAEHRALGPLAPGEEVKVAWAVAAGGSAGAAGYTILAGSSECPAIRVEKAVDWPKLERHLQVSVTKAPERPGMYRVEISLVNAAEAARLAVRIRFDDRLARLVTVQRGGFMTEESMALPWLSPPVPSYGNLVLEGARRTSLGRAQETYAVLWLAGPENEPPQVKLEVIELRDAAGKALPATVVY
ncbi:MAG: hypothetical protein ACM3ZC_02095 [Bacteroidota bacterium]